MDGNFGCLREGRAKESNLDRGPEDFSVSLLLVKVARLQARRPKLQ